MGSERRDDRKDLAAPASDPQQTLYRDVDLGKLAEALQRQVSGVHRAIEAFEKAKTVSQESLDYEVCL